MEKEPAMPYSGLTAADVMTREVITVRPETSVAEVSELFQLHNFNGAPVVDGDGMLVGIVTEDDVVVGGMGFSDEELHGFDENDEAAAPPAPAREPAAEVEDRQVGEIMTPKPIAAEEDTPVEELCRIMCQLKIHRIPIIRKGKVTGIVSTIDICRLIMEGRARLTLVG